jgi:DnaK suppressor protein
MPLNHPDPGSASASTGAADAPVLVNPVAGNSNSAGSPGNIERFRNRLRDMRDRMTGEVEQVVESIREDINPSGNLSDTPVHLADAAPESIDADINIIATEREMIVQIQEALHRIDDGTFGRCTDCGQAIAPERLEAIPYAARCIRCASKNKQ